MRFLESDREAPPTAQITANKLNIVLDFLVFWIFFWRFVWVLMIPKWLRMDCNSFWNVLGTSKNWPDIDPRAPYLLQKDFTNTRRLWKHCKNIGVCKYGDMNFELFWKPVYIHVWKIKNTKSTSIKRKIKKQIIIKQTHTIRININSTNRQKHKAQ